jgi:LmbE family N-acetylglucosaminyl deacetylase
MLALESRGHGVTVQLMTLTRGDGGQNKTGASFSDELGVLRTLELLESGRYYGVTQRFSRVADFGFSKTADETFQKWGGHGIALADLVRAIRTFTGTSRDGHGHHQASGILAREAVIAAADPNQFPEQIKEGLLPWKVAKLYHDIVPPDEKNIVRLDAGVKLPYTERTFAELGAEGYSHQKSQNATYSPPTPGPSIRRYKLIWPSEGTKDESDFFDGIETRLDHLLDRLPPAERELLKAEQPKLQEAAEQIELAAAALKQDQDSAAVPSLRGRQIINLILDDLKTAKLSPTSKANFELLLNEKAEQFQTTANLALDVHLAATPVASRPVQSLLPGEAYKIEIALTHAPASIAVQDVQLDSAAGHKVQNLGGFALGSKGPRDYRFEFPISEPTAAALTRPFWHRDDPEKDNLFTLTQPQYATLPLPPAPVTAKVEYTLDGLPGEITAIATTAPGNRRALAVEPAFSLFFNSATRVVPLKEAQHFSVEVEAEKFSDGASDGVLHIAAPSNWKAQISQPELHFKKGHSEQSVTVNVSGDSSAEGTYELRASLDSGGRTYNEGFTEVARDDLDHFFYFHPATERISIVDVKLPKDLRLCYVPGAGDDVAEVLDQLGMNVRRIPAETISAENLKGCDTVVLGIRAYDTQPTLQKQNKLLLDFVQQGGTLLVQNNFSVDDFNSAHFTPFGAELSRQRVSDETAPVTIADPASPLLHYPNPIAQKDFTGWVQERGVNFMSTWDKEFHPLLCSHDPGEQPLCGGLLVAQYGKGTYIYTGYSFFRQLPAGVPGAIRLFVNLVSARHAAN